MKNPWHASHGNIVVVVLQEVFDLVFIVFQEPFHLSDQLFGFLKSTRHVALNAVELALDEFMKLGAVDIDDLLVLLHRVLK